MCILMTKKNGGDEGGGGVPNKGGVCIEHYY